MTNSKPEKPLCLIYTGGTIGMQRVNGVLRPPSDEEAKDFIRRVAPEVDQIAEFEFVRLMNKDSTNMSHEDWKAIAAEIHTRSDGRYHGFVIAHGTDTMHFSASAVAFALGPNLNFPVVFTGSQTIPEIQHGDARVNLVRAFKVAQMDLAEVVITFGDFVFRGCRAQKKDEQKFDAFESPSFFPIGYVTERIVLTPLAKRIVNNPTPIDFRPDFSGGIIQVSLIPGLEPHFIQRLIETDDCRGLILQSFGAGNVPDDGKYSFAKVIHKATDHGIPTIVTSQFPAHSTFSTQYQTGKAAADAGAMPTGNMTSSCAAAKFRWVLANVERDFRKKASSANDRLEATRVAMRSIYVQEMDNPEDPPVAGPSGQSAPTLSSQ